MTLPAAVVAVGSPDWDQLSGDRLRHQARSEFAQPGFAAKVLVYANAAPSETYDEIANRLTAAIPCQGAVPLQSLDGSRRAVRRRERLEEVLREDALLGHRLIDLSEDGHWGWRVTGEHLELSRIGGSGDFRDGPWNFPLTAPPRAVLEGAEESDAEPQFAQRYSVDVPGIAWLSVADLIELGRFPPMQQVRERLQHDLTPTRYHCFISHRWQSPAQPDPELRQARLVAWQLLGHLCEALRVARQRGLKTARKRNSSLLGMIVGIAGSELAESLLVNLLRPAMDEKTVADAFEEARSIQHLTRDYGVSAARANDGLRHLAEMLEARPLLAGLLRRILLWYDYSCVPQAPRTDSDERLFEVSLRYLSAYQLVGRTVILLDDPDDYLSRAWCTLEALNAILAVDAPRPDLLVGSWDPDRRSARVDERFVGLIQDRPHLVWRAVLDTELFRIQSPERCMERLGLSVTERRDLLPLYQQLSTHPAPPGVHVDDSELVTGVMPLPARDGGALVPRDAGRHLGLDPVRSASLDSSQALMLRPDRAPCPPLTTRAARGDPGGARTAHVAVVASCEGEACLAAQWVLSHVDEIDALLNVRVISVSWTASDIAPVGHLVSGELTPVGIDAGVWILAAASGRITQCNVVAALVQATYAAGLVHVEIDLGHKDDNVRIYARPADAGWATAERVPLSRLQGLSHPGGLFRARLLRDLVPGEGP